MHGLTLWWSVWCSQISVADTAPYCQSGGRHFVTCSHDFIQCLPVKSGTQCKLRLVPQPAARISWNKTTWIFEIHHRPVLIYFNICDYMDGDDLNERDAGTLVR